MAIRTDDFISINVFIHIEGPEVVKWELGFAHFLAAKMGFHALGLGFIDKKDPPFRTLHIPYKLICHSAYLSFLASMKMKTSHAVLAGIIIIH